MEIYTCILIILSLIFIFKIYQLKEPFVNYKKVCNQIDKRCYKIVESFPSHTKASEILAYLNQFSIKLMRHLRNKYLYTPNSNNYRKNMIKHLLFNYNPDALIENAPLSTVNTSYVENKGEVFAICLRDRTTGKNNFLSLHILEFVVLHEMAHLTTSTIGHNKDFWINFKILLHEANAINLHKPIDYKKHPINYCNLIVDYNPYFDAAIPLL